MAANEEEKAAEEKSQDRNTKLRRDLQNVYASLQGEAVAKSFSAFTFEEAIDAQNERIAGASTQTRPNALDRVDNIANNAIKAAELAQKLRPEEFVEAEPDDDVNTPLEPDEDDDFA